MVQETKDMREKIDENQTSSIQEVDEEEEVVVEEPAPVVSSYALIVAKVVIWPEIARRSLAIQCTLILEVLEQSLREGIGIERHLKNVHESSEASSVVDQVLLIVVVQMVIPENPVI